MAKVDNRPWAFEDCGPWRQFVEQVEAEGLSMRRDLEVGAEPSNVCRGDIIARFQVFGRCDGERRPYLTTIFVHGMGPDGFGLYYASETNSIAGDVARLVALSAARVEVVS